MAQVVLAQTWPVGGLTGGGGTPMYSLRTRKEGYNLAYGRINKACPHRFELRMSGGSIYSLQGWQRVPCRKLPGSCDEHNGTSVPWQTWHVAPGR